MLKWERAQFELELVNPKAIEVAKAKEIRLNDEAARKVIGYYNADTMTRAAFDVPQAQKRTAFTAKLKEDFLAANRPAAGEVGADCSPDKACTDPLQCCGTATPTSGTGDALPGVCNLI